MASSSVDNFAKLVKKNPVIKKIMNDKKFKTTVKNFKKCVSSKCYDFNKFRREEKAYKKALNKTCKQSNSKQSNSKQSNSKQSNSKQSNSKHADIFEEMKSYKACQKKFNKTSKFPAKLIKQKKCIEKNCKEEERIYSEALIQAVLNNNKSKKK
jgi:hypothetical protein